MPSLVFSRAQEEAAKKAVLGAKEDRVAFAKGFFGIDPTPRQAELLRMDGRIQVIIAGRRFGKSTMSLIKAVHACATNKNQHWFVTAPSIDQAKIYFTEFERFTINHPVLQRLISGNITYHPFPQIRFRSGSVLEARSTSLDGMYLRGQGANGVVVTEAAWVKDVVWNEVIRALLLDRKGTALVETTPNGGGDWTYKLFQEAGSDETGYTTRFHATCYENTRIDELEIERIRRSIPDISFRQEYLAEFVDDDSAVFPWTLLQKVFDDDSVVVPGSPAADHQYVIGADLAKHRDFTVICVLDTTKEPYTIAEWHRTNNMRYTDIAASINEIAKRYNARVYLDATGVGDAVSESVENMERVVFTQKIRDDIIADMVVSMERGKVVLPPAIPDLRDELRYFRRVEHGASVKAEATGGFHDDCVMGLGLALYGARNGGYAGLLEYYRRQREGTKADPVKPRVIPFGRTSLRDREVKVW
ncbi:MAG: terminase large subunit domain-containing protein [Acidobacteriaceae bacterium]